ncbi:hypothetical protein K438DRAFT_1754712 [Mycena galopus ATCC 62051]|nr:hypothetical protein K438DRAFT_1754712 [Mycena galopus ATCC 62051]
MTQKPILISGGGLSSLLLAQALLRHGIPFEIYERDSSFDIRGNGYRLRLSTEGLDAIESVLGPEGFPRFYEKCGKTGGSGFTAYNAVTGEQTEHKVAETLSSRDGKVVGIARGEMRRLFYEGCEEHLHWSKHVTGYELTPDGVHAVFADGTKSVEGSMLIGGEGIHSKVAKQLSHGKLQVFDTSARGIHGQAPTTAFKGLGEGVFRLLDSSRPDGDLFIITNVRARDMDDPNIQFGWTMVAPGAIIKAPNDDYSIVGKQAADIAKGLTANFDPRFKPLFTEMVESEAAFWKITCSSPNGVPEWPNEPRVTVIGDAVHSMTPAGGIGANTAVQDSALLGRLIAEAGGYREGITAEYEKEMRVYGGNAVKTSYGMAKMSFGIDELVKPI